ncbi:class I SAM-dependent methyltransferase [Agrobacterium tumefaciens]|uniref:class I SAM-dependent methyltransferase n=1 Tax=Agrobacterium tumefaciens TaxID=358 RepID=UPI0015732293|nr:class I SAM-dependent methyltransferase [Agrobacterium tumefaciens]NSZ61882.1 class I SAM-dependent methyltransferase [Agrobacterium tumefaciens]NTA68254.1 class I SAM-dependent methyltransferase [Agrobacterium tumefaciens]WIE38094.1 class I SAM-dependent methyltransferase [Agrobacterium tumefaciens]
MAEIDLDDPSQRLKPICLIKQMLSYDVSNVDGTMSPTDTMAGPNYIWVGASAVEAIIPAIYSSRLTEVKTVLDMPCGHGRVLRHLKALFPEARIDACDIDKEGVEFCENTFGARPIISQENLTAVDFDTKYDLIWIGSLFTHTSREITEKWLAHLSRYLTDNGIIVATFHGRISTKMQYHTPYIDDARWKIIMDGYLRTGYGYADYQVGQGHDFIEGSYGLSVTKASEMLELVSRIKGVRVHHYQERGWANNHDVIAFGPPDWDDSFWPVEDPKLLSEPVEPPPPPKRFRERLAEAFRVLRVG